MNTQPDFEELLGLLEKHDVEYMIIGGYAVAFHGFPRFTKDLDIWFEASPPNVERLKRALVEFGFEERDLDTKAFTEPGNILTFGVPPVRVDLLNSIDGVTFEQARPGMVKGKYGQVAARFIGRAELLKNKRSTSRTRDKADAEELE